jgi:hypothetical protein
MSQHHFSIPIVIEVLDSRVRREAPTDRRRRQPGAARTGSARLAMTVVRHHAIRAHGEEPPDDWVSFPPPSAATPAGW